MIIKAEDRNYQHPNWSLCGESKVTHY